MADKVELDLAALEQVEKDLLFASMELGSIANDATAASGAVGHAGLASRVEQFASTWDDRRTAIIESVDALWKAVQAIHTGFEGVDDAMASRLQPGA